MEALLSQKVVADLHCHYYRCFDTSQFFEYASANLNRANETKSAATSNLGCLFLADLQWRSSDAFFSLFEHIPDFKVTKVQTESHSYSVTLPDATTISVIFGYQLVSEENLEVLVYGLQSPLPNNLPATTITELALEQNALVILPWGFGKWWFTRGKVIDSMISNQANQREKNNFYVGDNGNRLNSTKFPSQLKRASSGQIWNLPGSDPLPYASEVQRAGSMGAIIPGNLRIDAPLRSIQEALACCKNGPEVFGRGATLIDFIKLQTAMQIRKQFRGLSNKVESKR